jgi:hypothetical protein
LESSSSGSAVHPSTAEGVPATAGKKGIEKMRKRLGILGAAFLAIMMVASVAVAAGHLQPSMTDVQGTYWFADGAPADGKSVLTRTDTMITSTVEGANLIAGNAYTVWFVVFNNPAACSDNECGEDDIFTGADLNVEGVMAAQIGVGNATANIAKADGTAEFGAVLRPGDYAATGHQVLFPAGLAGDALLLDGNTKDAEVHLVIQEHGQARGGPQLLNQLTYSETGCTPYCEDIQFSVHKP